MSHPYPCLVCGIATFFRCSRCRNAWYCSSGHSHGDWKNHCKECRPALAYRWNMIAMPPPAEPQYLSVEAILFLADEGNDPKSAPQVPPARAPSHAVCPLPLLQRYFEVQPHNIVLSLGLNGEPLCFPLHIFYSATAFCSKRHAQDGGAGVTAGCQPAHDGGVARPPHF
ncbi:hypothetical protein B0H14DRAFT_2349353 [Mycena olivaceomarginata]|nr:hypothetical protein B0H14DRAFT_2349353 [Mycena olivaceomarginata]